MMRGTDCTGCRWFWTGCVGSRGWTGACDAHACVVSSSSPGEADCPEFAPGALFGADDCRSDAVPDPDSAHPLDRVPVERITRIECAMRGCQEESEHFHEENQVAPGSDNAGRRSPTD